MRKGDLFPNDDPMGMFAEVEIKEERAFLKMGIDTGDEGYNHLINRIEELACNSSDPILLQGAPGTGKTTLAERIYQVKKHRNLVYGPLIEMDCASQEGEDVIAMLPGLFQKTQRPPKTIRPADKPFKAPIRMIFFDDIDALKLKAQKALLKVLETGHFHTLNLGEAFPVDFTLICATNKNLIEQIAFGTFRRDLLSYIGFWTFTLPSLRERSADILPNIRYELRKYAEEHQLKKCEFYREALDQYLSYAHTHIWGENFRDLRQSLRRLCFYAQEKRISKPMVDAEFADLESRWSSPQDGDAARYSEHTRLCPSADTPSGIETQDIPEHIKKILDTCDEFDRVQLQAVITACHESETMASAGRKLFAQSRLKRGSRNDSDRLKKYLTRFGLDWDLVKGY